MTQSAHTCLCVLWDFCLSVHLWLSVSRLITCNTVSAFCSTGISVMMNNSSDEESPWNIPQFIFTLPSVVVCAVLFSSFPCCSCRASWCWWSLLCKLGCRERFVNLIRSFCGGMTARIVNIAGLPDPFPVYTVQWYWTGIHAFWLPYSSTCFTLPKNYAE